MAVEIPGRSIVCMRCGRKTESHGPIIVLDGDSAEPHRYCVWCARKMLRTMQAEGLESQVNDIASLTEDLASSAVVEFYKDHPARARKHKTMPLTPDEIETLEGLYGRSFRLFSLGRGKTAECDGCKSFIIGDGPPSIHMYDEVTQTSLHLHTGCGRRIARSGKRP